MPGTVCIESFNFSSFCEVGCYDLHFINEKIGG